MTEPRYDVLAMGRSLLDLYAADPGVPFAGVRSFAAYVGGCPANISVGARRLGLRTRLLTAVGDDPVGDFVLEFLRREGVDVGAAPRKAGRRTSTVLAALPAPDRPSLVAYRDNCADLEITAEDVARAPVAGSRAVLITGTGLIREPSRSATISAAHRARTAGAQVFLDLDYRAEYWPGVRGYAHAIGAALPFVDVAVGTADEVGAAVGVDITSESALDSAAASLLGAGSQAVVVKRGPRSTIVYPRDGTRIEALTFRVEVSNPLGAGDAFAAGLLYGRLQGWDWQRAARIGNACGAMVAGRHGCANFMPREAELLAFAAGQGGL